MSDDKNKDLEDLEDEIASHESDFDEDAGSDAFDALASGDDNIDGNIDEPIIPPAPESAQSDQVASEMPNDNPVESDKDANFADSFENNYESEFSDYDDFYDDNSLNDDEFDEFSEFDEDIESEEEEKTFDNAIDAEFSEFDESDDLDGADDDWSTEDSDERSSEAKARSSKNKAGKSALAAIDFSSPMVKYGAIAAGVVVIGAAAMMFMGKESTPSASFRAPSQKQIAASIPQPNQNQAAPAKPKAQPKSDSGQSLSSIINSGQLENNSGQVGMLDNLDSLENKAQPAARASNNNRIIPEFKERESLDTLASSLPAPTPIGNTINKDVAAERAARPADNAMDVAKMPVPEVMGETLSSNTKNMEPQVIPSPFSQTMPPQELNKSVEQDLKSIEKVAQDGTKSFVKDQTTPNPRQLDLEATLSNANQFMNSIGQKQSAPAQERPKPMDRLADNVSKFEQQTTTFIDRIEAVEQKLSALPNQDEIKNVENRMAFLLSKIDRLEARIKSYENEEKPKPASSSSSSSKVAKATEQNKTPVKKKVAPKPITWELRAASPGQAWVSQKGQKELKQIGIGDKLAGIGTIQNISLYNGKWVVTGSSGTITQ